MPYFEDGMIGKISLFHIRILILSRSTAAMNITNIKAKIKRKVRVLYITPPDLKYSSMYTTPFIKMSFQK